MTPTKVIRLTCFLIFLLPLNIRCQENLVQNPSLEFWSDGKPRHWDIITHTVDIFKSDYRVIPIGMGTNNIEFRSKFPSCGSDGLTYFGLAWNEIIQCSLKESLVKGKEYQLSFWVCKPPLYSKTVSNRISVKFTPNSARKNIQHDQISSYDTLFKHDRTMINNTAWERLNMRYIAKGGEKYITIGYLKDLHQDLGIDASRIYYLFDDFHLYEQSQQSKSFELFFGKDEDQITEEHIDLIHSYIPKSLNADSVLVKGYASDTGDSLYNFALSERRAYSISTWLKKHTTSSVRYEAFGESASRSSKPEIFRKAVVSIFYTPIVVKDPPINKCAFDTSLINLMIDIDASDQSIRKAYQEKSNSTPEDSVALKRIVQEMKVSDAKNLSLVDQLITNYGYPGLSLVGPDHMNTAFFVIQHAPLEARLRYASIIEKACQTGEMSRNLLPYFIDRNKLDNGQKQIYGTQVSYNTEKNTYELFPVEDPEHLDQRRAEYKLGSIKSYLDSFNQ